MSDDLATTVEQLAIDFLKALIANVGVEQAVRLVLAAAGPDAARVQAILAAEYAANDAAVDVLEDQKFGTTPTEPAIAVPDAPPTKP